MTEGAARPRPDAPLAVLAAGRATRYGGVKPLAPVGLAGEAVIDVLASDALAAGFPGLVLVVGPETGPAIRYHVERTWPAGVEVRFATQAEPRGTVDAVLAAAAVLEPGTSFAVANADDLPGDGLPLLAAHLASPEPAHALVAYRLEASLLGDAPVTRGICAVGGDGRLLGLAERRGVRRTPHGIVADDGQDPALLDADAPVSVNLWGFRPDVVDVLASAMAAAAPGAEVLLPEVVGAAAGSGGPGAPVVQVIDAPGRCIGVTHPGDVALVRAALAREVGRGERAARLWADRAPGALAP